MNTVTNPSGDSIQRRYESVFKTIGSPIRLWSGPWRDISPTFYVLEFAPVPDRSLWTYATVGMSERQDPALESHMVSLTRDDTMVELLTAIAHYHVTGRPLNLGHTVNFGRPWKSGSRCDHGLISLPYLDGPDLEYGSVVGGHVRCLWVIPITPEEARFKADRGLDMLEEKFDQACLQYANPDRMSTV